MSGVVDINVDMGEGFGRWTVGDDVALMPYISSASIATGFHAGDPVTLRRTVRAAVQHGLEIGAHVGLPDLLGFGRRTISVTPEDLRDYCVYQIGAISAFVKAEGGELHHVKPHGALYLMCSNNLELADAVAQAIAELDCSMVLLGLKPTVIPVAAARGVRATSQGFPDLGYDATGTLVLERTKLAWDPNVVAERALRVVREGRIQANDGTDVAMDVATICIHGDAPNALDVARTVRARLDEAGIDVRPLRAALEAFDAATNGPSSRRTWRPEARIP